MLYDARQKKIISSQFKLWNLAFPGTNSQASYFVPKNKSLFVNWTILYIYIEPIGMFPYLPRYLTTIPYYITS